MNITSYAMDNALKGILDQLDALKIERDQLKAENDALRKDAERYRWLRGSGSNPAYLCSNDKYARYFGEYMVCEERMDAAIDIAIIKDNRS